jgi:hypothetical protein
MLSSSDVLMVDDTCFLIWDIAGLYLVLYPGKLRVRPALVSTGPMTKPDAH